MHTRKRIDCCIELLKTMLSDNNNDLTPEQRCNLKTRIQDLKRLQTATKLTQKEIFPIVQRIAEAAIGVVEKVKSA